MTLKNLYPPVGSRPGFVLALVVLALVFGGTLYDLFRFCATSELYSYVLLMPLVSAYLARLSPAGLALENRPAAVPGGLLLLGGLLAVSAAHLFSFPDGEEVLSLRVLALILSLAGVCALFLGWERLRLLRFPLGMLGFMIPLPPALLIRVETFLQYGSAAVANGLFTVSGVPVFQQGLFFHLPGDIRFNVEPECSGIHSTLVLLITSLVAGHLMLRSRWHKALLVAAVIPLALLRNGFRIYVIGQLCVHYGAQMFQSWIHHRGGPLFFALSLVPFLGLLVWLVKLERRGGSHRPNPGPTISA